MAMFHGSVVLLPAVLLLGGCGGGDSPEPPKPSATPRTPSAPTAATPDSARAPAPPGAPAAVTIDPATAATITGRVNFTGDAPRLRPVRMDADPFCAAAHSEPVRPQTVVVNSNGTLQHVFVHIRNGVPNAAFTSPTDPVVLNQEGCTYVPHVWGVMAGQPIRIVNSDKTLHNVHALPSRNKQFNIAQPLKDMETTHVFTKPEEKIKFKCDVHPWMGAWCWVMDHPFFAVTDDQGQFQITGLPPGTYTVEAWHEKFGTSTQDVTVGASETRAIELAFAP